VSFFVPRAARELTLQSLIPARGAGRQAGKMNVTDDVAMRHSAVWACVRTRADLVSTFPVDVYRKVEGHRVEMPKPPILIDTGGEHWDYTDWMWASQADLDKTGNTIGLITERNALGKPSRIELQPIDLCRVIWRKGTTIDQRRYRIDTKEYPADVVWHERQFPVAGHAVGMSPIAAAAWTIGEYLSIQEFILDWFSGGGVPKAHLRNKSKVLKDGESESMKERFKATMANGDIFVTGNDWEYDFIQAQTNDASWINAKEFGLADVCRFFGVPADLVDAAISGGGKITYANITERNLQFLIMHLAPAVIRREKNLTKLLPEPRYVKLNTQALLRMDPKAMAEMMDLQLRNWTMTNTEARALMDKPPLTAAEKKEMKEIYGDPGKKAPAPVKVSPTGTVEPEPGKEPAKEPSKLSNTELKKVERMLLKGAIDVDSYSLA
jgi:HK97 family phage portal protein